MNDNLSMSMFASLDDYKNALAVQTPSTAQNLQDGFRAGWKVAAKWVDRDDLLADIGSPAYLKDMAGELSTNINVPVQPTYDKLLEIIAAMYQIAGVFNAPINVLDVLANPEMATQKQIDALLPFNIAKQTIPACAAYGVKSKYGFDALDKHKHLIGASVDRPGSAFSNEIVELFTLDQMLEYADIKNI